MSTVPQSPPVTPIRMTVPDNSHDVLIKPSEDAAEIDKDRQQVLPGVNAAQNSEINAQAASSGPNQPPVNQTNTAHGSSIERHFVDEEGTTSDANELEPFDWEGFQSRYTAAMNEARGEEEQVLREFDSLVNYFNVWSEASSQYDEERAIKRLRTREAYVQHAEHTLEEKRKHHAQVVEAFRKALDLLAG